MNKKITRIVLTGGPAAGKTTLISRILKEFTQEKGWKVVIIPETATELISGFGIGPFPGCMSMLEFQYFVIEDQLHKERLALKAAEAVPEEKVLVIYDRAIFDDKAYISDEEFREVLAHFGKTEAASRLLRQGGGIRLRLRQRRPLRDRGAGPRDRRSDDPRLERASLAARHRQLRGL